jgi:hypothetical protein
MLLYFPSIKVAKCDLVPSQYGATYLFYLKSTINSPKHYPSHPLIEGKVEFVGKIEDANDLKFWCNYTFNEENHKLLKGKTMSALIDFDPSSKSKLKFVGMGKKDGEAYFLFNKSMNQSAEERVAKMNYDLKPQNIADKKRIKV